MSVLTIAALKTQINNDINTNGIKSITGALLNSNLIDTIDSLEAIVGSMYSVDGTVGTTRVISLTDSLNFDSGKIFIDKTNGVLGLGTTNPFAHDLANPSDATYSVKNLIATTNDAYGFGINNGTVQLSTYMFAGTAAFGTTTNHDYHFMTNDTYRGVIDNLGNWGLGVLNPTEFVDVGGNLKVGQQAYSGYYESSTPVSLTENNNWDKGNSFRLNLGAVASDVTLTFSNPKRGATYFIKIVQGTNLVDVIFPSNVKFAGETAPFTLDVTPTSGAIDTVALFYDGTNYYANYSQNHG